MSYEQDLNTPIRYFVGMVDSLPFAPWGTIGGVALATPTMEAEGVTGRRAAFSHRFSDDDVADLNRRGAPNSMAILDALPDDWRYPKEA